MTKWRKIFGAGGGNRGGTRTKKKILSFLGGSKGSKVKESDKKVYLSPLHQNSNTSASRQRKKKGTCSLVDMLLTLLSTQLVTKFKVFESLKVVLGISETFKSSGE